MSNSEWNNLKTATIIYSNAIKVLSSVIFQNVREDAESLTTKKAVFYESRKQQLPASVAFTSWK